MPKYQIILAHPVQMADDEFKVVAETIFAACPILKKSTLLSAINLEGIRPETYERDDDVLDLL